MDMMFLSLISGLGAFFVCLFFVCLCTWMGRNESYSLVPELILESEAHKLAREEVEQIDRIAAGDV